MTKNSSAKNSLKNNKPVTLKVVVPNVIIGDLVNANLYKRKRRGFAE